MIGRVLRHLRAKPGRRHEPIRVLSRRELDAEKIQRPGRHKPLQEGLRVAPEPHDRALEAHLARAHRQERLGLGPRHLGSLLLPCSPPRWPRDEIGVPWLKADEVVPVRASREVTLDDAARYAALLSDQAGKRGGNEKPALGHGNRTPLKCGGGPWTAPGAIS